MNSSSPLASAKRLLQAGRAAEAAVLLDRAAVAGDAVAAFQLAAWLLVGQAVPRDLPRARALLARARAIGHVDAALLEVALTANGSGGPADWVGAREHLARAAATDPVAAAHDQLVAAMSLDAGGYPAAPLASEPLASNRVVRFPTFTTAAECAHVATVVGDLLAPAAVFDPRTGRQIAHPVRTSHEAVVGPMRESLVVQALNRRIARASETELDQGESLTVLRYAPGQQYRMHHDTIAGARNQRVATMIIYLNDGYNGGETTFPEYNLTVIPRAGDALLFRNTDGDRPDPRARHAGLPVTHGTKWIATRWIRARPFSPWTGPEAG